MASRGSSPEEIPHASTLALPDLEALLAQQEERSKEALGNALAKKQKAERLHERTRAKEGEAQTFRVDYEQAESAIQELRKLIVEKNKEALEKQFETKGLVRTAAKRPRPSEQESDSASKPKRVATETTGLSRAPAKRPGSSNHGTSSAPKPVPTETVVKRERSVSLPFRHQVELAGHAVAGVPSSQYTLRTKAEPFVLPHDNATPRELFAHSLGNNRPQHPSHTARMVRYDNFDEILFYASGQVVSKQGKHVRSVCAAVLKTEEPSETSYNLAFPVEKKGPDGESQPRTALTAALRAVVAALELKIWRSEGCKQVTIATDNVTLFHGITKSMVKWMALGWLGETSSHKPPSRELWRRAINLINEQAYHGCEVKFWLITAEQNQHAAEVALTVAPGDPVSQNYQPCGNVGFTFKAALEADE